LFSIIIFGGSRGIGKIIAEHFIVSKHEVTIVGRDLKTLQTFQQDIAAKEYNVNFVKADIINGRDVAGVFRSHNDKWHHNPDVVINCAADQGPIGKSWLVPVKNWENTININLIGAYNVARAAVNFMIKKGYGSIIMFSGGGAVYSRPYFSAYGVSKTGVLRMVETFAEELKLAGYNNIIINAVAPGAVKTRMTKEVIRAGSRAGEKALREATQTRDSGGTPPDQILDLINFLIDLKANCKLTGRLIHVRENYTSLIKEFGDNVPDEIGKIRRVPIKLER
jgi:NAD(P)-dependent dehydrogenase (short-subunit alcohol dehydrogenase family)